MKKAIRFTAGWCGPCKTYTKYWDKVVETRQDWEFQVVDVDKDHTLAEFYGIRSIPTTVILKDNELVATHVGVLVEKDLNEKLDYWK